VGSEAPEKWEQQPHIRLLGEVPDIKDPLSRYSVFICPILVGSGIRVKLLEAFASGIAAVSTSVGAEGLRSDAGPVCEIADTPDLFAQAVLRLLSNPLLRRALAENARRLVEQDRDSRKTVLHLEATYRAEVSRMRPSSIVKTADRVSSMAS
jgi:glycosyltransferase involved in cell wall biosynthesis